MEVLKFWRYISGGADASSAAFATDEEETDDEDSFFDLVFKSPDRNAINKRDEVSKEYEFIESSRDVLLSKNEFSNSQASVADYYPPIGSEAESIHVRFKKSSKCEKTESDGGVKASPLNQSKLGQSNRFPVKCRVADLPAAPVFAMENSLRSKMLKESSQYETSSDVVSSEKSVPRYLKLIKPFYVKSSNKAKLTDSLTPSSSPVTVTANLSPKKFSEGSRIGTFKIVARNLGKSRSASAAATVALPSVRRETILCLNRTMEFKAPFFTAKTPSIHHHKNIRNYFELQAIHPTRN